MSVNELIFNKARFFNVDENSLYKAIPKYVTLPKGIKVYGPPVIYNTVGENIRPIDHIGDPDTVRNEIEQSCLGVVDWGSFGQYYQFVYTQYGASELMYVKVSDVKNIKWR